MPQPPLPSARLRRQNMTGKRMSAFDLAGTRLLKPFGRTLMGLQLWHIKLSWVCRSSATLGTTFSIITQHSAAQLDLDVQGAASLVGRLHWKFRVRPLCRELLGVGIADLFGIRSPRLVLPEKLVVRFPQCRLAAMIALVVRIRVDSRDSVAVRF